MKNFNISIVKNSGESLNFGKYQLYSILDSKFIARKNVKIFSLGVLLVLFTFASNLSAQISSKSDSLKDVQRASDLVVDAAIDEMEGKFAEAILNYQEALKLDEKPGVHYAISKSYMRLNKVEPALEHAKKAVESEPGDAEYQTLLGHIYLTTRNADSARAVFERVVKIDSNSNEALFTLAMLYEKDNPVKALKIYKHLFNLVGPDWNILVKIAELNAKLDKTDETVSTFEKLIKQDPSKLNIQKLLIQTYIQRKNYDKAIEKTADALVLFPNDVNIIEMRAQAFIRKEEWQNGADEYIKLIHNKKITFETKIKIAGGFLNEALDDSTLLDISVQVLKEIEKDSTTWQGNSMLGEVYGKEKNDSLSILYYKKAAKLAEWNSQVWSKLGIALFQAGKYEECVDEMKSAIKNFPDDYLINFVYGFSLSQLQRNKEAEPYLAKAVVLNPNDVNTLSVYGFTLNQLKKEDEALTYITKALALDPENLQLLGMAGLICDGKEQFDKCDYYYGKAISIDSTNALVLNNYAYSLSDRYYYSDAKKKVQLEKALKMVNVSLEQDPENSSYLDTKGWIFYQFNNMDSAKIYVEKSLVADSTNASVLDHLGDIEFKLDNKDAALLYWKKALELDKENEKIKSKIEKGSL